MFRLMELMELDLSSVASVCKFADDILIKKNNVLLPWEAPCWMSAPEGYPRSHRLLFSPAMQGMVLTPVQVMMLQQVQLLPLSSLVSQKRAC